MADIPRVCFGPFEFDPLSGRLLKNGRKVRLQPKPTALLWQLVTRPGELVRRADLERELWPDGTNVQFDIAIKVAMKKLRDALGDDADEPIYIQTIYGEGYRFIAPLVHPEPSPGTMDAPQQLVASAAQAPTQTEPAVRTKSEERTRSFPRWIFQAVVALLAVMAVLGWRSGKPLRFGERDWIIIANVENATGEPVFDGSIEAGLEQALSDSHYVNVAPRARINDTLVLMRQPLRTPVTEDVARQVAIRDGGIKAVLAGRIEKYGSDYTLRVRLVNPATAEPARIITRSARQADIPATIVQIAGEVRRYLGESNSNPPRQSLEHATTASMGALRAFSAGMRCIEEGSWRAATELMAEAAREDPQFALAHVYAARAYTILREEDRAAPHYEAAMALVSGVTDRERLFIMANYYARRAHDDARALAVYEALAALHPDDYWGLEDLMNTYGMLGYYRDSMQTGERLLRIRPNDERKPKLLGGLWRYYTYGEPQPAKSKQYGVEFRGLRDRGVSERDAVISLLYAALDLDVGMQHWRAGKVQKAEEELLRVNASAKHRKIDPYTLAVAGADLVFGKVRSAKELCSQITTPDMQNECFLRVAFASGDHALAGRYFSNLPATGPPFSYLVSDIGIAASLGETARAEGWMRQPTFNAIANRMVDCMRRQPGCVAPTLRYLRHFEEANMTELFQRSFVADVLDDAGKTGDAIGVLEQDVRPAMASFVSGWPWPQVNEHLVRLYRKAGRLADAERLEHEMRQYLATADPDHPVAARLETAAARH